MHTQLLLCIPASGDDEPRGAALCQNLDSKKELLFCDKKKIRGRSVSEK